jgi:uncharacterized lipoprotein YmbA
MISQSVGRTLRIALAAGMVLLSGCLSAPEPPTFILLSGPEPRAFSAGDSILSLGPVTIADYLKRDSLTYRVGPNQIRYAGNQRWAEPLDQGIQRTLAAYLSGIEDTRVTLFPQRPARGAAHRVRVHVRKLEVSGGSALLLADWEVSDSDSGTSEGLFRSEKRLRDSGPTAIAAAYSDMLGELAEEIARQLSQPAASVPGD